MLRYLLFKAKLKFLTCGLQSGVEQCGLYLDRVNLLDQLLTSSCCYLPSLQQLTKPDQLRYGGKIC